MADPHVIGRELYELQFYSQREAHRLQSTVSRIAHGSVESILSHQLDHFCLPEEQLRFEQLVVDVGDIPYDRLEIEFPERFEAALRKELAKQIEHARLTTGGHAHRVDPVLSALKALTHFLLRGEIQWWSGSRSEKPENWLDALLQHDREGLVRLLRREGRSAAVRKRLVYQFPIPQLERIVEVLEPADAAFIIAYAHDLDKVHEKKPIVRESAGGFARAKWEIIFAYLLAERGSLFNRRAFLKSTIAGIAAHYNIAYETLLRLLSEAAEELSKLIGFRSSLPGMIRSLEIETEEAQTRKVPATDEARDPNLSPGLARRLELFRYFLVHGSFPPRSKAPLRNTFSEWVRNLLEESPSATLLRLRAAARFPDALSRYVTHATEPVLLLTVEKAEPAHAAVITSFTQSLRDVQQEQRLITAPAGEFGRQAWIFVLSYLFVDRGSYFNTRMFVHHTLRRIAAHYNSSYRDLLRIVHAASEAQQLVSGTPRALGQIIRELHHDAEKEEEKETAQITAETEAASAEDIRRLSDTLRHFFATGKLPWWARTRYTTGDMSDLLQRLLHENDAEAVAVLREAARDETTFHRVEERLDEESRQRFSALLAPSEAPAISEWMKKMQRHLLRFGDAKKAESLLRLFGNRLLQTQLSSKKGSVDYSGWLIEFLTEAAVRYGVTLRELLFHAADAVADLAPSRQAPLLRLLRETHARAGEGLYHEADHDFSESPEEFAIGRVRTLTLLQEWASKIKTGISAEAETWLINVLAGGDAAMQEAPADLTPELAAQWLEALRALLIREGMPPAIAQRFWQRLFGGRAEAMLKENLSATMEQQKPPIDAATIAEYDTTGTPQEQIAQAQRWLIEAEKINALSATQIAQFKQRIAVAEKSGAPIHELLRGLRALIDKKIAEQQKIKAAQEQERETLDAFVSSLNRLLHGAFNKNRDLVRLPEKLEALRILLFSETFDSAAFAAAEKLLKALLEQDTAAFFRQVKLWSRSTRGRERLARLLGDSSLAELLLSGTTGTTPPVLLLRDVMRFWNIGHEIAGATVAPEQFRATLLLVSTALEGRRFTSTEWLQSLLLLLGHTIKADTQEIAEVWRRHAVRYAAEWKSDMLLLLRHLSDPLYLRRARDRFLERIRKMEDAMEEEERRRATEEEDKARAEEKEQAEQPSVFLRNAGLVLLWPYLPQLFRRLGYVKGPLFTSDEAAYRAVHVLQYLVTKTEGTPEYELTLNKILCGVKKAQPVIREIVLTDEEKNICEELLTAALRSWPALRATTVEGLRMSFLMRDGKLYRENDRIELKVERKAFDKLLATLPWSINPIRLSWMEKPLYVEWKS